MFFQSQAFLTEKSQILSGVFWFQKKNVFKTSQNFEIWLQKSQIGNLAAELQHMHYNSLWSNKQNSFHNVITMDDLIKNYSNQMYQGRPNRGSLSFPKNCIFISTYCKM